MAGTNLSNRNGQLGPGLIGAFATLVLYGILTDQTYAYYRNYPRDHTGNKILVGFVWFLDTLNVAFMAHAAYWYFVTNYGDPNPFAFAVWSLLATLMLNIIVAFVIQIYFTMRIYDVSTKNVWLTVLVGLLVVAHCAFGLVNVVKLFIKRQIGLIDGFTLGSAIPWAVFSVVSDVAISAALCWLLSSKRTGFKDTNSLIDSLMIYAVNRCLLTCAIAILEVMTFIFLPATLSFIGIDLVTGKVYTNSLLATLNSRSSLRERSFDRSTPRPGRTTTGPNIEFGSNMTMSMEAAEMFGVSIPEQHSEREERVLDLYQRSKSRRGIAENSQDTEEKAEVESSTRSIPILDTHSEQPTP